MREIQSIGYGGRPVSELIERLVARQITHVADVRSVPKSMGRPDFDRGALTAALRDAGLTYVFLGDELGGRPRDMSCYVDGRVDYRLVRSRAFFAEGLERLRKGVDSGFRIALLCSEADPEKCHRSRLVGEALAAEGWRVSHIDPDGSAAPHESVMDRLNVGQQSLGFIDVINQSNRRVG